MKGIEIKATYRIVTPMFIGDAEQKATSIRPPSFKGALRFWWRALALGRLAAASPNASEQELLKEIHDKEAHIFGSAAEDKKGGGQGVFLLRMTDNKLKPVEEWRPYFGHKYLLGQGLYKDGFQRKAGLLDNEFVASLVFRSETECIDFNSVKDALIALGLLGGLGSRARRGLGSVSLKGICKVVHENREEIWSPPTDVEGLAVAIKGLKDYSYSGTPPYSALSSKSDILIWGNESSAPELLKKIGDAMACYRSIYGKGIFYPCDYDIAKNVAMGTATTVNPKRVVFGLPHNYFFSSINRKVDIQPSSEGRTRRASPLFIHVHELEDGCYCAVQSLLESVFLPQGDEIEMTGHHKNRGDWVKLPTSSSLTPIVDFDIIRNYLKEFTGGTII